MAPTQLPLLQPEERVLSTLESDGSRRWLNPKLARGKHWARRRWVAYGLIVFYTALPFIEIGGRPAVLIDLWKREFSLFGLTFLPTDTVLLALVVLTGFLSIFFATAVLGRVWCGWACPQTVYLEFVYRPLERVFLGVAGRGGKPRHDVPAWRRVALYVVFALISLHVANTFLAYFVGVEALNTWIWTSTPWRHPGAFTLVMLVTAWMMFDFCYWREQMCIIGCPYGRFQSVLLDKQSLIVGYDALRGEPRGRGRDRAAKRLGDCVDCNMCVDVCPTGIDIRDGLQLECINCTQCIDACDSVMHRIGLPPGLVRYSSQAGLDRKPTPKVRARLVVYGLAIAALSTAIVLLVATRSTFDLTLLRGLGSPFTVTAQGEVENIVRVKLVNRTREERSYQIEVAAPPELHLSEPVSVALAGSATATEPIHLLAPVGSFHSSGGTLEATLRVTDNLGTVRERTYRLFGPATATAPGTR